MGLRGFVKCPAERPKLHQYSVVGSVPTEAWAQMQKARVNCAEGKHFWSMNKGIQECLFCPARREAPSGGHL